MIKISHPTGFLSHKIFTAHQLFDKMSLNIETDKKIMGFVNNEKENGEKSGVNEEEEENVSEESLYNTEDDENDVGFNIQVGPQFSLKQQLDKDKDDESLRRWKEQLLGSVDVNTVVGETLEPVVKILNLSIISPGRPDVVLPIPDDGNPRGPWFTLKEGSNYSLRFSFQVSNNIVSGLKYTNTVWKTGIKVDGTKEMLGTFSPQQDPYTHAIPEDTAPSGFFARGQYTARTKFVDDDNKCHLEMTYLFDIKKDWASE